MSEVARLLLVRHAQPEEEARGRCYGTLDIGLSARGQRHAQLLARTLDRVPLAAIYTSPRQRAVETASPLASVHGLSPIVDEALREIDFGDFEGRSYEEIERSHPELYRQWMVTPTLVHFPGGESYARLRVRALAAMEAIRARHDGKTAMIVSHGGVLRALLAHSLSMPAEAIFRLDLSYGAVSIVEWIDSVPLVRLLNGQPTTVAAGARVPARLRRRAARCEDRPVSLGDRFERPALPPDFDDSRARERRADPAAWRFEDSERAGVWRAIAERRDIRRFRRDPLPEDSVRRLLEGAHQAPSVGLMQPWRFILIRSEQTKAAMQALAARERLVQAEHFDERARQYLDLKIEGIREAPLSICVCCDRGTDEREVLGRHTIRDTDLYSSCLAIENLWLAARAEGIGVGWVSFYREDDVRSLLGLPEHVVPVAWLCIGYPDERPVRPGLEAAGWERRRPLDELIYSERWGDPLSTPNTERAGTSAAGRSTEQPDWWNRIAAEVGPGDPAAAVRVRDASDELVKPAGSLGGLETMLERWAMAAGASPSPRLRAGVLVFAADHGVARHRVSLYPARVSAQVAAAAARGETAIGVLAAALDAELLVADIGLTGPRRSGLIDLRIADGSADITRGPALTPEQLRAAIDAGHALAGELAARSDLILVGEIGIGNTTVASALLAALTGLPPGAVCGRGTGLDSQALERKRKAVATALRANTPNRADPLECLRRLGGLEFAALVGALLSAAAARRPVLLDGFATGVAALAACRLQPALRDYLIAGHRSAEPAHQRVLVELGLEPLLDLRLRLGEASGAALALPLIGLAARLHTGMRRFDEAGVDQAESPPSNRP